MPKFLIQAQYTPEGAKGVIKDGGSGRKKAVETLLASLGGTLESMYFTFGAEDAILIMDVPSADTALAIAMTVRASGTIASTMTPLMTADDVDRAIRQHVAFHPPGE